MSDNSDDDMAPMSMALPVAPIPDNFNPNATPMSAQEYLQQVIWEAQRCPKTVTAHIDRSKIKKCAPVVKTRVKAKSHESYMPSKERQLEIMSDFSTLLSKVENMKMSAIIPKAPVKFPGLENQAGWCTFCLGKEASNTLYSPREKLPESSSSEGDEEEIEVNIATGQKPLLSILLNIKQRTKDNILSWSIYWIENLGFSETLGQWLYSLLSTLEKPMAADVYSVLREIIFQCAKIRASLDNSSHPHLPQLNVLICIIAKYFNQEDLLD